MSGEIADLDPGAERNNVITTRDCVKHTLPLYQIACESASMAPSQNIDVKLGELCLVPWSICLVRCWGRRLESPLGVTVSFT